MKVEGTEYRISFYYAEATEEEMKRHSYNRITKCEIKQKIKSENEPEKEFIVSIGYAKCSKKDKYDKIAGRYIAFMRAISLLQQITITLKDKEDYSKIVNCFFSKIKNPLPIISEKEFVLVYKEIREINKLIILGDYQSKLFNKKMEDWIGIIHTVEKRTIKKGKNEMNKKEYKTLKEIVEQLEFCNYTTKDNNHELKFNEAFVALKKMSEDEGKLVGVLMKEFVKDKDEDENVELKKNIEIIDMSCNCKECVRREKEFYYLKSSCNNCGWTGISKIRKGDKPISNKDCPNCKVSFGLSFGNDIKFEKK